MTNRLAPDNRRHKLLEDFPCFGFRYSLLHWRLWKRPLLAFHQRRRWYVPTIYVSQIAAGMAAGSVSKAAIEGLRDAYRWAFARGMETATCR
jgi:hypothetical protein